MVNLKKILHSITSNPNTTKFNQITTKFGQIQPNSTKSHQKQTKMSLQPTFLKELLEGVEKCEGTKEVHDLVTSHQDSKWWMEIPSPVQCELVKMVDMKAKSKAYDQVTLLHAILKGAYKMEPEVYDAILSDVGCKEKDNGLVVSDSEVFWQFLMDVSMTNIYKPGHVTKILQHPVIKKLLECEIAIKNRDDLVQVITDPGTDPNSDDEKGILFFEKMRYILGLWRNVNYVISAQYSLGERKERLDSVLQGIGVYGCISYIADTSVEVKEDGKPTRFFAPAAFGWNAPFEVVSYDECFGQFFKETDMFIVIGQLGVVAGKMITDWCKDNGPFRGFFYQGPGFNTMGTDAETLNKCGVTHGWSDTNGAAKVTKDMLKTSFEALRKVSPRSSDYRVHQVLTFMHTTNRLAFERMFVDWTYIDDYKKILKCIIDAMNVEDEE